MERAIAARVVADVDRHCVPCSVCPLQSQRPAHNPLWLVRLHAESDRSVYAL